MKQFLQVYSLDPEPRDFQIYTRGHLPIKNVRDPSSYAAHKHFKSRNKCSGRKRSLAGRFPRIPGHSQFGTWYPLHTGVSPGPLKAIVLSLPRLLRSPPIQCELPPMFQTHALLLCWCCQKQLQPENAISAQGLHYGGLYICPRNATCLRCPRLTRAGQIELKSPEDLPYLQIYYSKYPLAGLQTHNQGSLPFRYRSSIQTVPKSSCPCFDKCLTRAPHWELSSVYTLSRTEGWPNSQLSLCPNSSQLCLEYSRGSAPSLYVCWERGFLLFLGPQHS